MADLGPVTLEGRRVRLEPLRPHHIPGLLKAGQAPEIWPWMFARLTTEEALAGFVADALKAEKAGREFAFAVVDPASGRALGSTRYMDVVAAHKGLEIGWTWYAPEVWGTDINPEAKLLLLQHAFETWGALRVQLKTDGRNLRSQAAIRKLGAQLEGTLRNHRIRPDGTLRDTVMFSIIDTEWPGVKAGLLRRLGRM
jgi:N-acetyltransferase